MGSLEVKTDMRLTWLDGLETALVAGAVGIALAVTNGWSWWFITDFRSALVAMGIFTLAICPLSGSAAYKESPINPVVFLVALLGVAGIGIWIWGVASGGAVPMILFAGDLVVMWALTTVHHALMAPRPARAPAIAA